MSKSSKTVAQPANDAKTLNRLYERGLKAHQAGQFERARIAYEQILSVRPDTPQVNHLLGLVALAEKNLDQAASLIARALKHDPANATFHTNLGIVLNEMGKYEQALVHHRQAIKIAPRTAQLHNNYGVSLQGLNQHDEALKAFRQAITFAPNYAEAHCNAGISLLSLARQKEALALLARAIDLQPDYANAYYQMGQALIDAREFEPAISRLKQALALSQQSTYFNALGNAYAGLDRMQDAEAAFEKALELDPGSSQICTNISTLKNRLGDHAGALTALRKAVALDPDNGSAHRSIALTVSHARDDDDTRAIRAAYTRSAPDTPERMHLGFAMGKICEDQEQYRRAFDHFLEANAICRTTHDYDIAQDRARSNRIKDIFTPAFFEKHAGAGDPDPTPIFILGMPRSGTTLVEQILSSHPDVFGAGELNLLSRIINDAWLRDENGIFNDKLDTLTPELAQDLGRRYVAGLRRHSATARFITDKMTINFRNIGLIRILLPNAKIVHCRRDAAGNCLSIFKNYFATKNLPFAYNLTEIGRYHNIYRDIMRHWREVLAGQFHEIDYEALVADQETESRQLLAYCDLDWNPAVLDFHKTERVIQTASFAQVRQPIYKSSVNLAERYGDALDPLLKALAEGEGL